MNEYVGGIKLNYEYYSGQDLYSDGKAEDELLEIVQNHSEEEYNGLIAEKMTWPLVYHLSHLRQNIIEWYPFHKTDKILEIGSGCGAITGAMAKSVSEVTCVELSKKRSLINAYRNQSHDNIEIMVGNFQDIEQHLPNDFDYITLIGVLEYAESYIQSGDDSFQASLAMVAKHLKSNGHMIVAIENKYGLKYWAGCKEDHVGRYYEGLEGYTTSKGVKTFSKKGLERLFAQAGLKANMFYYPYPDYKLPVAIYSDLYLPKRGELNMNHTNIDDERMLTFDEGKVYDTLIDDEMYPEFANSFLVIVSKEE